MSFAAKLTGQCSRPGGAFRVLVKPDQQSPKPRTGTVYDTLALAPGVKTAAVDSQRAATIVNAVVLAQLADQFE